METENMETYLETETYLYSIWMKYNHNLGQADLWRKDRCTTDEQHVKQC